MKPSLEALHMSIATMVFMSLTVSSLFSMMRRNVAVVDGRGDGGGRSLTTDNTWIVAAGD